MSYWLLEFSKLPLSKCFKLSKRICVLVPVVLFDSKHIKLDLCVLSRFLQSTRKASVVLLVGGLYSVLISAKLMSKILRTFLVRFKLQLDIINLIIINVFRGGSELKLNSLAYFNSRVLWEGSGCLWCETFFSGLTFPLVESVISWNYNVVVVPMFLFYGDLCVSFRKCKFVAGHVFSEAAGVKLLFKYLRCLLLETGLSSCELCKYRLFG
ncbi:MAG: hypothetical protein AAJB65_00290 [Candidatus Hodgkinia cicadicola]